jgi:hypothetical protein
MCHPWEPWGPPGGLLALRCFFTAWAGGKKVHPQFAMHGRTAHRLQASLQRNARGERSKQRAASTDDDPQVWCGVGEHSRLCLHISKGQWHRHTGAAAWSPHCKPLLGYCAEYRSLPAWGRGSSAHPADDDPQLQQIVWRRHTPGQQHPAAST